jgi:diaminopimelate epimerase
MNITIYKYQGAGNDFVIADNRSGDINLSNKQIELLCHRRYGIGADGLMLLSSSDKYSFKMEYFNSDGFPGSMCGNGARCLVAFASKLGIKEFVFEASDGVHTAKILSKKESTMEIELHMTDVSKIKEHSPKSFYLDTGSPHFVLFINNLESYDVKSHGKMWRYNPIFPSGTNVNFVQGDWGKKSANWSNTLDNEDNLEISVRTYERGVEDETYACGTGITASALAYHHLLTYNRSSKRDNYPLNIYTKVHAIGGELAVKFRYIGPEKYDNIYLIGPATFVFKCNIEI